MEQEEPKKKTAKPAVAIKPVTQQPKKKTPKPSAEKTKLQMTQKQPKKKTKKPPVVRKQPPRQKTKPREAEDETSPREWNSGLCDCMQDQDSCLIVTLAFACGCHLCYGAYLSERMNEGKLLPFCVPNFMVPLRTKLRLENDIEGSISNDNSRSGCCLPCVMCQMERELDYIEGKPKKGSASRRRVPFIRGKVEEKGSDEDKESDEVDEEEEVDDAGSEEETSDI